ncbi:MAG: tRNA pseudouridine(55) synthase TruB [Actinobacteria bacterium]|nr:MAG: tRNA pseudouridine(55) synthase TruB [Actinomycetota bacterium]
MSFNGILLIDKPAGITSHDVIYKLRKITGIKRIGHTGTLDPMAIGLLVILVGSATKSASQYTNADKEYHAEMVIGIDTDTQDRQGKIVSTKDASGLDKKRIYRSIKRFTKEIEQYPPMYSAVKIGGKKLYQLARQGKIVKRDPRKIIIYNIEVKSIRLGKYPVVEFSVACSKGTYIRTLCHDIGKDLGYGAHLSALKRTKVGNFSLENAVTIKWLENNNPQEAVCLPM